MLVGVPALAPLVAVQSHAPENLVLNTIGSL